MTTTDYLINAIFILLVLRQARERRLDFRSVLLPIGILAYVAHLYLHSLPTAGNDLVLIIGLAAVGLTLGVLSGLTTFVRRDGDGAAFARVGWLAGGLLIAGFSARIAFEFAVTHGAAPAIRSFSIVHQISAPAWPTALVLMAILEVAARIAVVQIRARRLTSDGAAIPAMAGATA
jgi:hypothetical protein